MDQINIEQLFPSKINYKYGSSNINNINSTNFNKQDSCVNSIIEIKELKNIDLVCFFPRDHCLFMFQF